MIVTTMTTSPKGRKSSTLAPHHHHYATLVQPHVQKRTDEEKRRSLERGRTCADTFNWFHGKCSKKQVRGHVEPLLHEPGDFCVHKVRSIVFGVLVRAEMQGQVS